MDNHEQKPVSKQIYIFKNTLYPIVKIGMSDNPSKRMGTIECAAGFPLELAYESEPITRPQLTEKLIHKRLKEYRTRGEWFSISVEDAIIAIEQAVSEAESGEYKDLTKEFQLKRDCVEVSDYHVTQGIITTSYDPSNRFEEQEEFIYKDKYFNYYILYTQGFLKRTAKFCNLHLAKKFKESHLERLVKME